MKNRLSTPKPISFWEYSTFRRKPQIILDAEAINTMNVIIFIVFMLKLFILSFRA